MISFKRGQGTKKSLGVGLFGGINYIVFQIILKTANNTSFTAGQKAFPLKEYLLSNNRFNSRKVYNKERELYWYGKQTIADNDLMVSSVKIQISFVKNLEDSKLDKAKNERLLEMIYGKL